MTYHVDITEAQQRFLDLIQAAEHGEEVIITRDQQPLISTATDSACAPPSISEPATVWKRTWSHHDRR
jgi:antitoxin (DNA-binding transcriptional repressor) of toxin-antitoxin stability system